MKTVLNSGAFRLRSPGRHLTWHIQQEEKARTNSPASDRGKGRSNRTTTKRSTMESNSPSSVLSVSPTRKQRNTAGGVSTRSKNANATGGAVNGSSSSSSLVHIGLITGRNNDSTDRRTWTLGEDEPDVLYSDVAIAGYLRKFYSQQCRVTVFHHAKSRAPALLNLAAEVNAAACDVVFVLEMEALTGNQHFKLYQEFMRQMHLIECPIEPPITHQLWGWSKVFYLSDLAHHDPTLIAPTLFLQKEDFLKDARAAHGAIQAFSQALHHRVCSSTDSTHRTKDKTQTSECSLDKLVFKPCYSGSATDIHYVPLQSNNATAPPIVGPPPSLTWRIPRTSKAKRAAADLVPSNHRLPPLLSQKVVSKTLRAMMGKKGKPTVFVQPFLRSLTECEIRSYWLNGKFYSAVWSHPTSCEEVREGSHLTVHSLPSDHPLISIIERRGRQVLGLFPRPSPVCTTKKGIRSPDTDKPPSFYDGVPPLVVRIDFGMYRPCLKPAKKRDQVSSSRRATSKTKRRASSVASADPTDLGPLSDTSIFVNEIELLDAYLFPDFHDGEDQDIVRDIATTILHRAEALKVLRTSAGHLGAPRHPPIKAKPGSHGVGSCDVCSSTTPWHERFTNVLTEAQPGRLSVENINYQTCAMSGDFLQSMKD